MEITCIASSRSVSILTRSKQLQNALYERSFLEAALRKSVQAMPVIFEQVAEVCVEDVVQECISWQREEQHGHAELCGCANS